MLGDGDQVILSGFDALIAPVGGVMHRPPLAVPGMATLPVVSATTEALKPSLVFGALHFKLLDRMLTVEGPRTVVWPLSQGITPPEPISVETPIGNEPVPVLPLHLPNVTVVFTLPVIFLQVIDKPAAPAGPAETATTVPRPTEQRSAAVASRRAGLLNRITHLPFRGRCIPPPHLGTTLPVRIPHCPRQHDAHVAVGETVQSVGCEPGLCVSLLSLTVSLRFDCNQSPVQDRVIARNDGATWLSVMACGNGQPVRSRWRIVPVEAVVAG